MSAETKETLEKATVALRDIDIVLLGTSAAESSALDELMAVRKRRAEVGLSVVDSSVGINLLQQLEYAEAEHDKAAKRHQTYTTLRNDYVRAHEKAQREHHASEVRDALPEALASLQEDLNNWEIFLRGHRHTLDLLKAAEQNVHGVGYTMQYVELAQKYGVRPDMGSAR